VPAAPVEFGIAPVAVSPVEPGAQGLMTPVLFVGPVPIDMLLAPEPVFPESELLSAIVAAEEFAGP